MVIWCSIFVVIFLIAMLVLCKARKATALSQNEKLRQAALEHQKRMEERMA